MKKLVLMFVAIAAISFASCGNKAAQQAEVVDSVACCDTIACDTTCCDSVCCDSVK